MSGEPKDPAIKLFGKTIPLPEIPPEAAVIDRNQNHGTGPSPEDTIRADEDVGQDNKVWINYSIILDMEIEPDSYTRSIEMGRP